MKKIKELIKILYEKGVVHIFIGSFLTKLVAFFGSIFLVRILSKWDYGVLGYIENIYGYIFIFAGMGLSNAMLRYVVLGKDREEKYSYYFYSSKTGFWFNVILIVIAGIICGLYPHPEAYAPFKWLLCLSLIAIPFQYLTDNVLCNERAMFANQRFAILSLILAVFVIASKIFMGSLLGLSGVLIGQIIIYALLAIGFLYSTHNKYYKVKKPNSLSSGKKREVSIYSLQYMITNGLWAIFMLNDTFLLGRFLNNPVLIADYKVAYALPGCVALISNAIGIFVAPYFVKNESDKEWVKINFFKAYLIVAFIIGGLCFLIGMFAKPLIIFIYGENYLNIITLMRILLVASFFNCGLRYTTANILAAMGQVKYNMFVSLFGMIAQVFINIMIIPLYGVIGLAITSCIVYAGMALVLFYLFIKKYY